MALAQESGEFELVSIDSMQVYRGMDIGTAKPSWAERQAVPHYLIDLVDPDEEFALAEFQRAARSAIATIEERDHRALLVGGTGLYLQAITDNFELPGQYPEARAEVESESDTRLLHGRLVELDPVAAARMEPDNRRRIVRALEVALGSGRPFSSFGPGIGAYPETEFQLLALRMDSERNSARIEKRVDAMFEAGLVDEVRALNAKYQLTKTAKQALGYKEILNNLDSLDVVAAADEIKARTRSFARRQRAWFRRDPRITFFDVEDEPLSVLPALQAAVSRPE